MKINYKFDDEYKKILKESTKLTDKVESLIFEPKVNLVFKSESYSTAEYEIRPEIIFWWIDDVAGKFANENLKEYEDDIMGGFYFLRWSNDKISIYFNNDLKDEKVIFESIVSRSEVFEMFRNLSKLLHKEMETINPIVKKSVEWFNYNNVNKIADATFEKGS